MSLFCVLPTKEINDLAKELKLSPAVVAVKVGLLWQSRELPNNTYPSAEDLRNSGLLDDGDSEYKLYGRDTDHKLPCVHGTPNKGMSGVISDNGQAVIVLQKFNENNGSVIGNIKADFATNGLMKNSKIIGLINKSLIQSYHDANMLLSFIEYEWLANGADEKVDHYSEPFLNNAVYRYIDNYKDKPAVVVQPQAATSTQTTNSNKVQRHQGDWSRQEVTNNPKTLYLFTDNTDRDSGKGLIPNDSWYSKKYGEGHHFPTMTSAVIRGLDNARPISTQRWYHDDKKREKGRWNDEDIEEFKKVIDDEFDEIIKEWNTGKYDTIMLPENGLFNSKISNISKERTPKLYQYLWDKCMMLQNTVNGVKGENISSKGSEFAKRLTNPFNKETVEFRGTKFDNAEHAYQTWKSGKFDQKGYDAHGGKVNGTTDYNTNYQTMVEIITAKLQQHPDLVQGIDERGGEAYLKASTHDVIGDKYWETKTGQNKFIEALTDAYNRIKSMPANGEKKQYIPSPISTMKDAEHKLNAYIAWQDAQNGGHVRFDEEKHEYYIDGKKADYSVTGYEDELFGKKEIDPNYEFIGVIGTSVDKMLRDYFIERDKGFDGSAIARDRNRNYPNFPLTSGRRKRVVSMGMDIETYLKDRFEGEYKVITKEFYLTGRIKDKQGNDKTIAGTMDMLVIDKYGNLHIFDFKTKSRAAEFFNNYNDKRDYTYQLNAYKQLIEATMPEFKGKVKSLQLIWMAQSYDTNTEYKVNKDTKEITMSDGNPMSSSMKWEGPHLGKVKYNDIKSAIISIEDNTNDTANRLQDVRPYNENWLAQSKQVTQTQNTMNTNTVQEQAKPVLTGDDVRSQELKPEKVLAVTPDDKLKQFNKAFDPMQRTARAEALSHLFSTVVDDFVDEKLEKSEDYVNDKKEELDRLHEEGDYLTPDYYAAKAAYQEAVIKDAKLRDSSTGRQEVIKSVGIANVFKAMKDNINDTMSAYRPDLDSNDEAIRNDAKYKVEQYQAMLDNFELLLVYAAPFIANEEHVALNIHRTAVRKGNTKEDIIDATVTDVGKEEEEDEKFGDDEEGKNVSGNDGWEYKPRYTNPINRLTHEIKSMLSKIVRLDSNGKVVYDDLGNPKYLPSEFCHAVLINLISKINSPDDFVLDDGNGNVELPALEKFKARYPWIQGVINYIQNSDHPMRTASKFYSDFRNNFISYWRQFRDENGRFKSVALNKITGEESALNRAITNYEQGFRNSYDVTIDGEDVTLESIYGKKEEENKENAVKADRFLTEIRAILDALKDQPSLTTEQLESGKIEATDEYEESETPITPEDFTRLKQGLQAVFGVLGFEFEGGTLGQMLTNPETLKDLSDALDEASTIFKKVQSPNRDFTSEEKEKAGDIKVDHLIDFCKNQYKSIATKIGTVLELEDIQSFRIGDKTLYSFSTVNYIDTMFKELFAPHGTEELENRKRDYLQRQYGKYGWFKNQKSEQWKSGWIRDIENGYIGDTMEMKDIEGTDYPDWTPTQIKAAFIRQFYSIQAVNGNQQEGWFNAPIFANSPVAKFIKFKLVNDRKELISRLCEVAEQELWRMDLVESRKKAGVHQIANFDIDKKGNSRGMQFCFFPQLNDYRVVETDQGTLLLDKADEHLQSEAPTFVEVIREDKKKGRYYKRFLERAIEQMMEEGYQDFLKENFEYNEDGTMGEQMTKLAKDIANDHPEYLKDAVGEDGKPILDKKGNPVKEKTLRKEVFLNLLEKYYYEQVYASTQIIELTTTDLAYYKNGTDFQKRYKELYASGKKLNTNSQFGRKIERTGYIKDVILTSHSYTSIKRVLDRAVALGHIQSYDRDAILEKFKDVNQADAQAYRNLDSMKALLDMIGEWTDDMERALNNFINEKWTMEDFNLVWQTIKPFVYTQIEKPDGLGGVIKVPHQNKNSEFLILAFYNVIASPINGSPVLRAMDKFMSDNEIDVLQFESAAKAGNQGTIDLSYSEDKLFDVYRQLNENSELKSLQALFDAAFGNGKVDATNTANWTYDNYKDIMDYMLDNNLVSQEVYNDYMKAVEPDEDEVYRMLTAQIGTKGNYNPESVHEIPYDDYVIQQPTPEHLFDVDAVFGSQFRNLIISDMPDDFKVTIHGKEYNKKQIRDLYQAIIVENLLEDWKKVKGKYETIEKLQAALKDAIESNTSKYSRDLLNAIEIVKVVNPVTGKEEEVFNIPLDNPSTTEKLQQITNSMFKNAIQKQKIKGGACILVSDFGLTGELRIKFKKYKKVIDENGEEKTVGDVEGGIEGIECYLPAYSKKFYTPFMKRRSDGTQYLDINSMPEDLRKIIGYRIPTEDKYSMAPLIVKGFLPQQNGSSIMLPSEITQIAGSDFDVDKMFLMIPEFRTIDKYSVRDLKRAWDDFYKENPDIAQEVAQGKAQLVQAYGELLKEQHPDWNWEFESEEARTKFLLNAALKDGVITVDGKAVDKLRDYDFSENAKPRFKEWLDENKNKYLKVEKTIVEKVRYNSNLRPEFNDRRARNNMLIDISYAILQHPDTAEKILNPGNFDKMKTAERIATITSNSKLKANFAKYLGVDPNDSETLADRILEISTKGQLKKLDKFLKDYKRERSPLTLDTFIYNHSRNMKGDALIGMYANNTSMQAKYQETGISIKDKDTFVVNGRRINSLHEIFSKDNDGNLLERISKNCANGSAASVDNVKDPTLDGLKQNTKTANITGFMLRAGMSWQEIGLLFTQPIIGSLVDKYGDLTRLPEQIKYLETRLKSLGTAIKEKMLTHDFTSKEMLLNILNRDKAATLWLNHKEVEKSMKQDRYDKMTAEQLYNYIKTHSLEIGILSEQEDVLKYIEENTNNIREEIRKAEEAKGIARESHEAEYKQYLANDPNVKFLVDYYTSAIMVANLMSHIMELSKNLSDATQISRADSPNGAIKHDIAGARAQIAAVERYSTWTNKPDFYLTSKDSQGNEYDMRDDIIKNDYLSLNDSTSEMRKKLLSAKMPMLQAFYSLGIDLAYKLVGQYYTYTQPAVDKIVRQLYNNTERGQVYDTVLKKFYNEIMEWALTKTDLFGGKNFETKRNYYLYEYPKIFNEIVRSNPALRKIGILKKITVSKGDLVYERSGRLSVLTRETLMRDFDSLLYSDSVDAQQLAVDLFMYCFYKAGLKFGATGFGSFFSTNFLTSFPEYINALRTMKFMAADENSRYFDGFLEQFYINHFNDEKTYLMPYYDSRKIVNKKDKKNNTIAYFSKDDKGREYLAIRNSYVWNENMYYSQKKHESFQYIKIFRSFKTAEGKEVGKMELYRVWGDGNSQSRPSDYTTYLLVPTLTKEQKDKRGVKYNANMTATELAAIQADKEKMQNNARIKAGNSNDEGHKGLMPIEPIDEDETVVDADFNDDETNVDVDFNVEDEDEDITAKFPEFFANPQEEDEDENIEEYDDGETEEGDFDDEYDEDEGQEQLKDPLCQNKK